MTRRDSGSRSYSNSGGTGSSNQRTPRYQANYNTQEDYRGTNSSQYETEEDDNWNDFDNRSNKGYNSNRWSDSSGSYGERSGSSEHQGRSNYGSNYDDSDSQSYGREGYFDHEDGGQDRSGYQRRGRWGDYEEPRMDNQRRYDGSSYNSGGSSGRRWSSQQSEPTFRSRNRNY